MSTDYDSGESSFYEIATKHISLKHLLPLFGLIYLGINFGANATAQEQTTSDGMAPIICPHGALTSGLLCEGDYCDDITMRCDRNVREVRSTYWTRFVHTSGHTTDPRAVKVTCGNSRLERYGFMSGIACAGDYCDNVAIQCSELELFVPDYDDCRSSGWFSEEDGWRNWPAFYFPVQLICNSTHCDRKRVLSCRLRRRSR